MKKAALHNLGCKVNSYETEAMQQLLEKAGYEIVPFQEGADVYIINTCSVTNIADKKSRQMLHRARKMNPSAVVAAVGCYVQAAGEELKKDPAIDLVIGNNRKTELVSILEEYMALRGEKQNFPTAREYVLDIGRTQEYENMEIQKVSDHTRAFIKVQDGCSQFCSYCIIPYTRGRVRSRRSGDVVREVRELTERGYQEIVVTGIHLSSYGADCEAGETLLDLIKKLHAVKGLRRIRLGSLEPRIITEEFAGELSGLDKICPHFHLSLQSGCDETLRRMNRRYTTAEYEERCKILRRHFDHPAVTTDVITGFPGETEEEFQKTRCFLEKIRFYEMHVFKYSRRAGTKAAAMPDQIPETVKAARSDELILLEAAMSRKYRELSMGRAVEVLWEDTVRLNGENYRVGHTREYVKAAVLESQYNGEPVSLGRLGKEIESGVLEFL